MKYIAIFNKALDFKYKMKGLFGLLLALCLTSCVINPSGKTSAQNVERTEWTDLNDSICEMIQYAVMMKDRVALDRAIELSDSLLASDAPDDVKKCCSWNRQVAVEGLKHAKDDMKEMEKFIKTIPENESDRYYFTGILLINQNKPNRARPYFSKAIKLCDERLAKGYNSVVAQKKLNAIYFLGGEEAAAEFIEDIVHEHPEDEGLRVVKEDLHNYAANLERWRDVRGSGLGLTEWFEKGYNPDTPEEYIFTVWEVFD